MIGNGSGYGSGSGFENGYGSGYGFEGGNRDGSGHGYGIRNSGGDGWGKGLCECEDQPAEQIYEILKTKTAKELIYIKKGYEL